MKDIPPQHDDSRSKGCMSLLIGCVIAAIVTHVLLIAIPNRDDSAATAIERVGGEIQRTPRLLMLSTITDTPMYTRGAIWDVTIKDAEINSQLAHHLSSLRSLDFFWLYDCRLPEGMTAQVIPTSKVLRRISISDTNVGDAQMTTLSSCPNLSSLSLEGTEVSDASVPEIVKCRNLHGIHLERNRFTDKGIQAIRAAFPSANLTTEHKSFP